MADKYDQRMNARVADVMEMKRGLICDDGWVVDAWAVMGGGDVLIDGVVVGKVRRY
jgi:hypothetical protein